MNRDLPQLEFVLTDADRRQAAYIAWQIERQRRERNARERAAEQRKARTA